LHAAERTVGTVGHNIRRYSSAFAALLLVAPLAGGHDIASSKLRAALIWIGVLGLWAILVLRTDLPTSVWSRFLVRFPDVLALGFLAWAAIVYALNAPSAGREHGLALAELLRIACGVVLYIGARYAFPTRRQLREVWFLILIFAALDSIAGIISTRSAQLWHPASAAYGNKELLAAFLVGLVPFVAVTIRAGPSRLLRGAAVAAMMPLASALLLTGNRTSWIAAVVGLGVAAVLTAGRNASGSLRGIANNSSGVRWAIAAVGIAAVPAILLASGGRSIVRERFVAGFGSLEARLPLWHAALDMIQTHPLTGIGIGAYPLNAHSYSHGNEAIPPAADVIREGSTISSIAHNEYLQTAAEIGLIGLALYLSVLVSFLILSGHAWFVMQNGFRRILLTASISAVIAQSVDGIANPGWRFADVAPILWFMLALGMTAIRIRPTRPRRYYRERDVEAGVSGVQKKERWETYARFTGIPD
jgi:O-antigen ligase